MLKMITMMMMTTGIEIARKIKIIKSMMIEAAVAAEAVNKNSNSNRMGIDLTQYEQVKSTSVDREVVPTEFN